MDLDPDETEAYLKEREERALGLYADKCEECTTGLSCEQAGRCLFEG